MPEELVFGAEGLRTVWLWAVEGFLSCVTQGVEPELLLWGKQGPAHQTLVPTCFPYLFSFFPLPLSLFPPLSLSLSLCPWQRGCTPKQLGGSPSSLFLRRQCGNTLWGIGGSSCHGSPRVPLPWKFTCGSPALQAQRGKFWVGKGCQKRRHSRAHRKGQRSSGNIEVKQNLLNLSFFSFRSSTAISCSLLLTQSQQLWLAVSGKHCSAFLLSKKFPAPH